MDAVAAVGAQGSSAQQKKKLLMDALLLALRNSEVARVVDMGTLEYFLDQSYAAMVRGDSFDLTKLWDILAKEPGIESKMVYPPLLAYKSWEERLGVTVFLPGAIKSLSPEERKTHEARCPILAADLEKMLTERKLAAPKAPAPKVTPKVPKPKQPGSGIRLWPAAIVAALGLGVAIFAGAWYALTPRAPSTVDTSAFEADLALKDGKRVGESMSAVIADPGFASQPEGERSRRVMAVFNQVRRMGIKSLLLFDDKGAVRATAQAGAQGLPDQVAIAP
jgi:hypothetical protein